MENVSIIVVDDDIDSAIRVGESVARSLTDSPPWLNCRLLYDARGSQLFEEITEQPEYYLTRTENQILERHAGEIRDLTGDVTLIELGSGYSVKTAHLLDAYTTNGASVLYVPVDISRSALEQAGRRIRVDHPSVNVTGIQGSYESAFPLFRRFSPSMVMFLGSTIGNFNPNEADAFWNEVRGALAPGDFFLLGVDLVKNKGLIEAAYNDAAGKTSAFTTNIFAHLNSRIGSNVDLSKLQHVASYNPEWQRVETFIRFLAQQDIHIGPLDKSVTIPPGTMVMIEISRKFTLEQVQENMVHYGLDVIRTFTDEKQWFAVLLLRRTNRP